MEGIMNKFKCDLLRKYVISGCAVFFCVALTVWAAPSVLCDFESGQNTDNPEGGQNGYFRYHTSATDKLPVDSPGAAGTQYCLKYLSPVDLVQPQAFYINDPAGRTIIAEAQGANRFQAWIKLPPEYKQGPDRNVHLGTYTRDPLIPSNLQGNHYYHYFNIPGSPYWSKLIANEHPCHLVSTKVELTDNPTAPAWNYYDGFTRFYLSCAGNDEIDGLRPKTDWYWYFDQVGFYRESEPENTVSINAVSCSYFGDGHFQLNWHGQYRTQDNHHYEARYSTAPITNANYAAATLAPGCDNLVKVPGGYSWVRADFTIKETAKHYYFAIKDLDSDSPYVTRIDYEIFLDGSSASALSPPANLRISQ